MFPVKERGSMVEANRKRLKESQVLYYGGELSTRVVLEYDGLDRSYRTFLETFTSDGKPGFKAARYLYWKHEAAVEDYNRRLGK
jgi:hypothetical protein